VLSLKGHPDCHILIISSAQRIEHKIFYYTMKETIAEYVDMVNVKTHDVATLNFGTLFKVLMAMLLKDSIF
jgi:hypothetical protein